jgi:Carboxypeptidase regulatory-like domain
MSNIMRGANKALKDLGMLGITLSLAGMSVVGDGAERNLAPSASAKTLDSAAIVNTVSTPQSEKIANGKLGVYAIDAATGKALAGANVVVVDLVTGQSVNKGVTRADGSYSTALPAGAYKVAVFAPGYKPQSEFAKIAPGQATILKIAIRLNNTLGTSN